MTAMPRLKIGFIPIEGGHYYQDALEEVVRAEELGFASVWMEEHHSVVNHYWPSPITVDALAVLPGLAIVVNVRVLDSDRPAADVAVILAVYRVPHLSI